MITADAIAHMGKEFPLRTFLLSSPTGGGVQAYTVASLELQGSLIDDETGAYRSPHARLIDEQIFFYVEQAELLLADPELARLVADETNLRVPASIRARKHKRAT